MNLSKEKWLVRVVKGTEKAFIVADEGIERYLVFEEAVIIQDINVDLANTIVVRHNEAIDRAGIIVIDEIVGRIETILVSVSDGY